MRLSATLLLFAALLLAPVVPAHAYTLQFTSTSATTQIKWPTTNITVALSSSLSSPPSNVRATGEQVVLAARRALARWSQASNIQFTVTASPNQDAVTDGVSLITIADTGANRTLFNTGLRPGRARVTFDPTTGSISEADLAINPNVTRTDFFGNQVASFFSTDGAEGSYDLESTFVHEIGHMLGLEHSGVVGASMQPRQGTNGTFNLPNFTTRTLASDDVAGIRAIYGPRTGMGSIFGRVGYNHATAGTAAFGAHVFAEDVATGRVVAGNVVNAAGNYRIDGLPPGQYRVVMEPLDEPVNAAEIGSNGGAYPPSMAQQPPFQTTEAGTVSVNPDAETALNVAVTGSSAINPRFIGTVVSDSFQLSTVAVPIVPGQAATILVGGDNLTSVSNGGVTINSPFITVSNVQPVSRGFGIPIISFDITPSILTPPGEYSVRLQTPVGQAAYVSGGLTVDLPIRVPAGQNLLDNAQFFVAQHYRDFLNREPDQAGLAHWTNQMTNCGNPNLEVCRINVSAAFFLSIEFQETGYFAFRAHQAAFNTGPGLEMGTFLLDTQRLGRGVVVGQPGYQEQLAANQEAYTNEFVARPEFLARYPTTLSPAQFVDALNANTGNSLDATERQTQINNLAANNTQSGRAAVLRAVLLDTDFARREFTRAFVYLQYVGYLRRNPDDPPDSDFSGYNFWLTKLNQFNGNFIQAEMVKAFLSSIEYQSRFGTPRPGV